MAQIILNGKTYEVPDGNNVSVMNGTIEVGGVPYLQVPAGSDAIIEWRGPLVSLKTNRCITVKGNVQGNIDAGGDVTVYGNVNGSVDAGNTDKVNGN